MHLPRPLILVAALVFVAGCREQPQAAVPPEREVASSLIRLNTPCQGTYNSAGDAEPADVPPTITTVLLSLSRRAWCP